MNLHITNTDTGLCTEITAADLTEEIRQLITREGLNPRHDVTLYIWHGKDTPPPAIKVRDFHGQTASAVL